VIAAGSAPPDVGAVAVEDDTYFVLGAPPVLTEPTEHPIRIWTELHDTEPARPGSVRVRDGHPLRLHAVVHDLSQDPTWRETWISSALTEILHEVERRDLRSVALPILGAMHGKLPVVRFLELLRASMERGAPSTLERLWVVARPTEEAAARNWLANRPAPTGE